MLGHVAQGRHRVAGTQHRQLADGRPDQVLNRVLQALHQRPHQDVRVQHPRQVVDQPGPEGEAAARRGQVEVVEQRVAGRRVGIARRQAAAQRVAVAVPPRGIELVVGQRLQGVFPQVGPAHRAAAACQRPRQYPDRQPLAHHTSYCTRRMPRARGERPAQKQEDQAAAHLSVRQRYRRQREPHEPAQPHQQERAARLQQPQAEPAQHHSLALGVPLDDASGAGDEERHHHALDVAQAVHRQPAHLLQHVFRHRAVTALVADGPQQRHPPVVALLPPQPGQRPHTHRQQAQNRNGVFVTLLRLHAYRASPASLRRNRSKRRQPRGSPSSSPAAAFPATLPSSSISAADSPVSSHSPGRRIT